MCRIGYQARKADCKYHKVIANANHQAMEATGTWPASLRTERMALLYVKNWQPNLHQTEWELRT